MKFNMIIATVALFALATPLTASDLSNRDDKDYSLRVVENDEERTVTIKAGETIEDICTACVLYLEDDEEGYDVFEDEEILIVDGELKVAE